MSLDIITIHEKGKQDAEYVELKVLETCNLNLFLLSDTTYASETSISNKLRHVFWFNPKEVVKGDFIFLRTGKGSNTEHKNRAGTMTHVIYWGLDKPVWNNSGDAAILFTLRNWKKKKT